MSSGLKTIGQVAKELGVSTHTLRYYEKINLLPPIPKDISGIRQYDEESINRIRFICRAKRMLFSLDEIKQLFLLDSSIDLPKPEVQTLVKNKLQLIDDNLRDLSALKEDLTQLLSHCKSRQENDKCPILEGIKSKEKFNEI